MWFLFALLSAVFAALTSILAKIGIENVDSNLATAIRTTVVLALAWGIVLLTGKVGGLADIGSLLVLYDGPGPGGHGGDQPPELALPHPIGAGHRGVLAVLLPRPSAGGRQQGGAGGQVQRGDLPGIGFSGAP